ncbi:MAG: purine-nucleoside phosphorylase [Treponema sp.]|jgi:purine-nucleoside phosphorylase|nr:purine-nucleoside phosphorylase [Treponema sp.]
MLNNYYLSTEGTPHNNAKPGDFARTVLMPGDPLRAQYLAENYLENVRNINTVRGMLAFTGTYKKKPISVMGSGMGVPSMGIYSYELFTHYGVENIIRIGTCGGLVPEINVGDLVLALASSTNSNYAHQYRLDGTFSACATYELLEKAVEAIRASGFPYWVGNVLSSDIFSLYGAEGESGFQKWARLGCGATDMESYALYCNAAYCKKKALTILTCSDSDITGDSLSAEDRQKALKAMFQVGLSIGTEV